MEQIKSKKRVRDFGEVYTSEREVKAMCDLVDNEAKRIDSRFLEPACGDGNFLDEVLRRKLSTVRKRYGKSHSDYEKFSVLAVSSVYGIDILMESVTVCRHRLFNIWNEEYTAVCERDSNEETRNTVKYILFRNIVCGNALSLKAVDENAKDTNDPIVLSEWAFIGGNRMQRSDYRYSTLLSMKTENSNQPSLFSNISTEPEFLNKYITDYRSIGNIESFEF